MTLYYPEVSLSGKRSKESKIKNEPGNRLGTLDPPTGHISIHKDSTKIRVPSKFYFGDVQ